MVVDQVIPGWWVELNHDSRVPGVHEDGILGSWARYSDSFAWARFSQSTIFVNQKNILFRNLRKTPQDKNYRTYFFAHGVYVNIKFKLVINHNTQKLEICTSGNYGIPYREVGVSTAMRYCFP